MSEAYIDSSAVVAMAFGEPGGTDTRERLGAFDQIVSSNLLEAEVRAAYMRDGRPVPPDAFLNISWVFPRRGLRAEFDRALSAGYLRGADLWHIATALYIAVDPPDLAFITLDARQRSVASALGFRT